jgi:hypothetical protein
MRAVPHGGVSRRRLDVRKTVALPFVLSLILIVLWLPQETSFYIFGLRLTATRLIFLLLAPALIVKFGQRLSSGRYRFILSDFLFLFAGFWMIYAPANVDGLVPALNHAGPDVLELCIGYLATRLLLSEHGQALAFADLLCKAIAIVALIGLLDTLTGTYITRELARRLTGNVFWSVIEWSDSRRMGLLRATGPIEHPIWFGFICTIGLLIAISVPIRARGFAILLCGIGAVISLSSAPLQCAVMGVGLVAYDRLLSRFSFRWLALMMLGAGAVAAAYMISNNPIGWIISHLIYDPYSGYYRVWTWDQVTLYVSTSPWYGLGFGILPDPIKHSIDSLWLTLAIHSGWPGCILVAVSIVAAGSVSTGGNRTNLMPAEARLGTTLGIIAFLTLILAATATLLGTLWVLTGMLAGVKAHLGDLNLRSAQSNVRLKARGRMQLRTT